MNEYLHNGEKVIYQITVDDPFLGVLNRNGITPEELPDENFDYRVFKYSLDGQKRYACVINTNAPDATVEKVFTTFVYPEDGFYNLMVDVNRQRNGEEPQKIKSRFAVAWEKAENLANEYIKNKYPDKAVEFMMNGYPEDVQKDHDITFKMFMAKYGYDDRIIESLNIPDSDIEFAKTKLK